jgi:hypothetical protein
MSHGKVLGLVLVVTLVLSCSIGAAGDRSYVSGNYSLTLGGEKGGFVKSVDGGAVSAEVINEPVGPSSFTKKHIGAPKYEDFTIQVGFSMNKVLYNWIQQSWAMNYKRMDGSIVALDYELNPVSERQFNQALLTETTIPAMDGSSKEPSYITVKFAPEVIRTVKPGGTKADYSQYGKTAQKLWLPSNFKLEIPGLDCTKVSKIDSFTVKQTVVADNIGEARDYQKEPGKLTFPNLKITLAEAAAQTWLAWHEDFVLKGNNGEQFEKGGTLTLLAPDLTTVLAQIKFYNMGIFRIQTQKAEAADTVKRVQAELYVERMEFLPGPAAGGTTSTPTTPVPQPAPLLSPPTTLRRG